MMIIEISIIIILLIMLIMMIYGCTKYSCYLKPSIPKTDDSAKTGLNSYGRGLQVTYSTYNFDDKSKCNCGFVYPMGDSGEDPEENNSSLLSSGPNSNGKQIQSIRNNTGGCNRISLKDHLRKASNGGTIGDISSNSKKKNRWND